MQGSITTRPTIASDTFSNLLRRLASLCTAFALAASTWAAAADPGAARDLDDRSTRHSSAGSNASCAISG